MGRRRAFSTAVALAAVDVVPPSASGECATLTAPFDLGAIEASGGVPGPTRALAR